jgi:hypothetical protein
LFGEKVLDVVEAAANQPYVGAMVPEFGEENFRERRVGNFSHHV